MGVHMECIKLITTTESKTFRFDLPKDPENNMPNVEVLQLRVKFQTAMVSCSRFIWITNSIDHRRV